MASDRERLLVAISSVAEVFNRGLSDVSLRLYAEAMAAWPVEAVEGSLLEVVRTSRFMPTPAEWGEHATEWWRGEHERRREERLRARALAAPPMTPAEVADAEAKAKALRDELAAKLGWRDERSIREDSDHARERTEFWARVDAARAMR